MSKSRFEELFYENIIEIILTDDEYDSETVSQYFDEGGDELVFDKTILNRLESIEYPRSGQIVLETIFNAIALPIDFFINDEKMILDKLIKNKFIRVEFKQMIPFLMVQSLWYLLLAEENGYPMNKEDIKKYFNVIISTIKNVDFPESTYKKALFSLIFLPYRRDELRVSTVFRSEEKNKIFNDLESAVFDTFFKNKEVGEKKFRFLKDLLSFTDYQIDSYLPSYLLEIDKDGELINLEYFKKKNLRLYNSLESEFKSIKELSINDQ